MLSKLCRELDLSLLGIILDTFLSFSSCIELDTAGQLCSRCILGILEFSGLIPRSWFHDGRGEHHISDGVFMDALHLRVFFSLHIVARHWCVRFMPDWFFSFRYQSTVVAVWYKACTDEHQQSSDFAHLLFCFVQFALTAFGILNQL